MGYVLANLLGNKPLKFHLFAIFCQLTCKTSSYVSLIKVYNSVLQVLKLQKAQLIHQYVFYCQEPKAYFKPLQKITVTVHHCQDNIYIGRLSLQAKQCTI